MTDSYLPKITKELLSALKQVDWLGASSILQNQSSDFGRIGLDRLVIVSEDLRQTFGRSSGFSVLDVGCSTGLISYGLAALGNEVTGVDLSYAAPTFPIPDYQTRGIDRPEYWPPQFYCSDIRTFLRQSERRWDIILLLNVIHHWRSSRGYGGAEPFTASDFQFVISKLVTATNCAIYYERPEEEEGFLSAQYSFEDFLRSGYSLKSIRETVGPNGYRRRLFRLDRNN